MKIVHFKATLCFLMCAEFAVALECFHSTSNMAVNQRLVTCSTGSGDSGSCVTVDVEGLNTATGKQRNISARLCDSQFCNTTRLCQEAISAMKNFISSNCRVVCCKRDMCNTTPFASKSTVSSSLMQTESNTSTAATKMKTNRVPMATILATSCYECEPGTTFHACAMQPEIIQCESKYDTCFSVTGSLSIKHDEEIIAYRGCGKTEIHCNKSKLCEEASVKVDEKTGLKLNSCTVYCCRGELCNTFDPTRPVKQEIQTGYGSSRAVHRPGIKVRRTPARDEKFQPIRCHACIPETLSNLCHGDRRKKSCPVDSKGSGYDGCFTMTAVITNATTGMVVDKGEWKDCSVSEVDCSANSSRCKTFGEILDDRGLALQKCNIKCCKRDMCNNFLPTDVPSKKAMAKSDGQTNHVTQLTLPMATIVIVMATVLGPFGDMFTI